MLRILKPLELKMLSKLNEYNVSFMLVGMTAAILQGAYTITEDIDIWVKDLNSQDFIDAIKESGGFYIPAGVAGMNPPMIGPGSLSSIDLVTHLHGLGSFDEEIKNTLDYKLENITVKVLNIERIIKSKEAANREKDRVVLPALKALIAAKKIND